jgi:hypothetical protein
MRTCERSVDSVWHCHILGRKDHAMIRSHLAGK